MVALEKRSYRSILLFSPVHSRAKEVIIPFMIFNYNPLLNCKRSDGRQTDRSVQCENSNTKRLSLDHTGSQVV